MIKAIHPHCYKSVPKGKFTTLTANGQITGFKNFVKRYKSLIFQGYVPKPLSKTVADGLGHVTDGFGHVTGALSQSLSSSHDLRSIV